MTAMTRRSHTRPSASGSTPPIGPARHGLIRRLLVVFVADAVVTAGLLAQFAGSTAYRVLAGGFLVAAVGNAALVVWARRSGTAPRRTTIGTHCVLVPLLFAATILTDLAWIGLALSIVILVALRPVFPTMTRRPRKTMLVLHLGLSVGWLGTAMCMLVLSLIGLLASDPGLRHRAYQIMHIFDLAIVIPLVLLSVLTGLVMSLGTKWGLLRHWWVLAKFTISVGIVAVAAIWENFWVRGLAEKTADPAADLGGDDLRLAICMAAFTVALWVATILSVFKPWGKTPWTVRRARRRESQVNAPRPRSGALVREAG